MKTSLLIGLIVFFALGAVALAIGQEKGFALGALAAGWAFLLLIVIDTGKKQEEAGYYGPDDVWN